VSIVAVIIAILAIGVGIILYENPRAPSPSRSVEVIATPYIGQGSGVLNPKNNSISALAGNPFTDIILNDTNDDFQVTIINNGTTPVYMNQIVLTTNNSAIGTQLTTIPAADATIPAGQSSPTFTFYVTPITHKLSTIVEFTFTATGNDNVVGIGKVAVAIGTT